MVGVGFCIGSASRVCVRVFVCVFVRDAIISISHKKYIIIVYNEVFNISTITYYSIIYNYNIWYFIKVF